MKSIYGYARFTVIVYTANRPGLPVRPALNYFEWNASEPKEAHGIVDEDLNSGYHCQSLVAYTCKLQPVVCGRNHDLAISA